MIMGALHHLGPVCVPPRISMTKRWGPVGFMRIGGMGLGQAPSPVGFPDFASFQNAVISSFPACPAPFDPTCENPRDAAIAAALNSWVTNSQSCANVVCNAAGQPQITPAPSGSGSGFNTTGGFVPVSTQGPNYTAPPSAPPPAAPPQPSVVNPSPPTQLTTTGSSATAPGSAVSQANGTVAVPGCDPGIDPLCVASTVGGFVPTVPATSGDIVAGVPNWVLAVAGGVALVLLARK